MDVYKDTSGFDIINDVGIDLSDVSTITADLRDPTGQTTNYNASIHDIAKNTVKFSPTPGVFSQYGMYKLTFKAQFTAGIAVSSQPIFIRVL